MAHWWRALFAALACLTLLAACAQQSAAPKPATEQGNRYD